MSRGLNLSRRSNSLNSASGFFLILSLKNYWEEHKCFSILPEKEGGSCLACSTLFLIVIFLLDCPGINVAPSGLSSHCTLAYTPILRLFTSWDTKVKFFVLNDQSNIINRKFTWNYADSPFKWISLIPLDIQWWSYLAGIAFIEESSIYPRI